MATKSFTTEFKLSSKAAASLITALDESKRVDVKLKHEVSNVHDKKDILNIVKKSLGK